MRPPQLLLTAALSGLLFTSCRPADEITTYRVPREPSAKTAPAAPPAPPMAGMAATPTNTRMVAGMLRGNEQAWFFKLTGDRDKVSQIADSVRQFLESVEYDAGLSRPVWKTPAGWKELPAEESNIGGITISVLATFVIPVGEETLELKVTPLSLRGDWPSMVRVNTERWRGQVGLEPMSEEELAEVNALPADSRKMFVVDLASAKAATKATPMPNKSPAPAAGSEDSSPISYQLPDSWKEGPRSSFRLVNLLVGEGDAEAQVRVSRFSSEAEMMADPLANINRWRGEIGMPSTTQEEIDKAVEQITVGGAPATLVVLLPEAGAEATIAAMSPRGPEVWFFKFKGPAETVKANRDLFREWLASVKYNSN